MPLVQRATPTGKRPEGPRCAKKRRKAVIKGLLLLIGVMVLGSATPAWGGKSDARYQRAPQRLIFQDEVVHAGRKGPEGTVVQGRRKAPRTSLIRVRTSFLPELLKSAENL